MKKQTWLSDKDYDFIYQRSPRLCVDLLIQDKQGVLLTKRLIEPYKNTWHFPGGRVKFRELLVTAINRIAKAELGTTVTIKKFVGYIEMPREVQNGKPRHSVSLVFLVNVDLKKLKGSWQAEERQFFKVFKKSILPPHGKFLKENKFLR